MTFVTGVSGAGAKVHCRCGSERVSVSNVHHVGYWTKFSVFCFDCRLSFNASFNEFEGKETGYSDNQIHRAIERAKRR